MSRSVLFSGRRRRALYLGVGVAARRAGGPMTRGTAGSSPYCCSSTPPSSRLRPPVRPVPPRGVRRACCSPAPPVLTRVRVSVLCSGRTARFGTPGNFAPARAAITKRSVLTSQSCQTASRSVVVVQPSGHGRLAGVRTLRWRDARRGISGGGLLNEAGGNLHAIGSSGTNVIDTLATTRRSGTEHRLPQPEHVRRRGGRAPTTAPLPGARC